MNLGHVDPVEELEGVQCRLNMVGYESGAVDGKMWPITENAVKRFRKDSDLVVDGSRVVMQVTIRRYVFRAYLGDFD